MTALEKAVKAAQILDLKKASDVEILDVSANTVLTEYFVIAHGKSSVQVRALAENVEDKLAEAGIDSVRKEGGDSSRWMLLDYGDVIVHVFEEEARGFFNLEKIWADSKRIPFEPITADETKEETTK